MPRRECSELLSDALVTDPIQDRVSCTQCEETFTRPSDLNRHMKTHASEEEKEKLMHHCPYVTCSYKTLQMSNLNTHINRHTGERPYKCPTEGCGFSTGDSSSLNRHRKSIHGYEPSTGHRTRKGGRQRGRCTASLSSSRSTASLEPSPSSTGSSSGSTSSAAARLVARQWGRYTPYPTTASPSRLKSRLEPSPPRSLSVAEGQVIDSPGNMFMAYSTGSVTNIMQPGGSLPSQNVIQDTLPLDPGLLSTSNAFAARYSRSTVPEQEDVYTALPVCDMAVTEEVFNNFLSRFNDSPPVVPSLPPATTFSNTPAFTPATLAANHVNYAAPQFGDFLTPAPPSLPSHGVQYPVDSVPRVNASVAMCLDEWYSQPTSFVTPDMGVHSQGFAPDYTNPSSARTI